MIGPFLSRIGIPPGWLPGMPLDMLFFECAPALLLVAGAVMWCPAYRAYNNIILIRKFFIAYRTMYTCIVCQKINS